MDNAAPILRLIEKTSLRPPSVETAFKITQKFAERGYTAGDVLDVCAYGDAVIFFFRGDAQVAHRLTREWA